MTGLSLPIPISTALDFSNTLNLSTTLITTSLTHLSS